jgi:hypothetical protein
MKRIILIILFLLISFLTSCVVDKPFYEGYNGVVYQKNHEYYYMSNEKFMKNYYHYDLYPNDQFKKKKK